MLFTNILHTLSNLWISVNGLRGVPTTMAQGILPGSVNDGLTARLDDVPVPLLQLQGYSHLVAELSNIHPIVIPEGTRVNVQLVGGNWTKPDGTLLANVLPGVGGEQGYVDKNGLFHLDVRYVVQFVSDKKYGYVQLKGFGTLGVINKGFVIVETDSAENLKFNGQQLYAPGAFIGPVLSSPLWSFV